MLLSFRNVETVQSEHTYREREEQKGTLKRDVVALYVRELMVSFGVDMIGTNWLIDEPPHRYRLNNFVTNRLCLLRIENSPTCFGYLSVAISRECQYLKTYTELLYVFVTYKW